MARLLRNMRCLETSKIDGTSVGQVLCRVVHRVAPTPVVMNHLFDSWSSSSGSPMRSPFHLAPLDVSPSSDTIVREQDAMARSLRGIDRPSFSPPTSPYFMRTSSSGRSFYELPTSLTKPPLHPRPVLPAFVNPPLDRRPTTRSDLLVLRQERAMKENTAWFETTRSVLPRGQRLGAPGRRFDAPPRYKHLDAHLHQGGPAREKWWGRVPAYQ